MFKVLTRNTKSGFVRSCSPQILVEPAQSLVAGNSGGFTIVELVAVMVILGICLAPVGAMFYTVMSKYAKPEAIQVATALAEGEMERVTGLDFVAVANEGPTAFASFPNYTYQVIVSVLAGQPDTSEYKEVEVKVVNTSLDVSVSLFTVVTVKQVI